MSLRFIYGRAGSGKSIYCLNDIKRKIEKGFAEPLILLVPEQFSFQAERNVIRHLGEEGAFKVQVLSFSRMAQRVFSETGGLAREHINDAGRSMLIYSIMSQKYGRLKAFRKIAKKQGFAAGISEIITEFKRCGIKPEDIAAGLEKTENTNLKGKLEDLYLIYDEFEKRLHEQYIDQEDDLEMLASKLGETSVFDGAEIWIDEFSGFTYQECNILKKLFTKASRINVTLCSDGRFCNGSTDVFLPVKNTEDILLKIASDLNIVYDKPIFLDGSEQGRFSDSDEIKHLEEYLFSYPYKPYESETKKISILRTLNKYDEVEETARDIVRLCRDRGLLMRDIAVVSGEPDAYLSLIRAVFSEYKIPFFIDGKDKIVNSPLIVLLSAALDIVSKNWSYESMFEYLKTGMLDFERTDIDLLENFVLANGIKGKDWLNDSKWQKPINDNSETNNMGKIDEIRKKIVLPLAKFSEKMQGKNKGKVLAEAFYQFMCDINIKTAIENLIIKFEDMGQLDRANEYRQVWEIIIELLDQAVNVLGDESITGTEFAQIMNAGFMEYEIGIIPPSIDQVLVGSIQRLKSHDIKALYILGVNDGSFPSPIGSSSVLTDDERLELIGKGINVMKDSKSMAFEEQFLIYTTLTTASEYLRLSFPVSDFDGKSKRPSIIISRLKKIFPKIKEENKILKDMSEEILLNNITADLPAFNDMMASIKQKPESSVLRSEIKWFRNNEEWEKKLETVSAGFKFKNEAHISNSKALKNLYGKKPVFSVSKLEKFVECPFAYFIMYGLKAKERKIYKLGTPDVGVLMHESIFDFSEKIKKDRLEWKNLSTDQIDRIISEIVDKKISDSIFESSKRYKFIAQNAKNILKRSVSLIAQHIGRGEFEPAGYELSFGYDGDYPPIEVELDSGEKVSLVGKIDRMDILKDEGKNEAYIRIVDYKSGKKEFKITDVYHKLQMQLLIYLDAMLEEIAKQIDEKVLPAGILYFRLDNPLIKEDKDLSSDEIEKKIMNELKMSGLIIDNINIIYKMDPELKGTSDILPVRINNDESLSAASSAASLEQFELLRRYVKKSVKDICEEILKGNISINPYKKSNKRDSSPCKYCIYSSICQFDLSFKGNQYRILKEAKAEEAWKLIEISQG